MLARLGDVSLGGPGELIGRVLGVAAAITAQGLAGVSFGMAVVGLAVLGVDEGGPPGVRRAALRHAWILALLLTLLPSLAFSADLGDALLVAVTLVGSLLAFAGIVLPPLLLGTVIADEDGRGLHDRWAGTAVVPTPTPRRPAATVGILLLAWATLTGAAWWLGEPDRVDSDRLGTSAVERATCDVRYDPPVGDAQQHTIELAPGMDRAEIQLGPHVVRFDDEPFPSTGMPSHAHLDEDGTEGLFYELLTQSSFGGGSASASSSGTGRTFSHELELGRGLAGALAMECRGEDAPGPGAVTPPAPSTG